MASKRIVITKKKILENKKIAEAKGLSKKEQTKIALKQEQKLKTTKDIIQEFDEWE